MLAPRRTPKRNTPPTAFRAAAYALSLFLVLSVHIAVAERAAQMLA